MWCLLTCHGVTEDQNTLNSNMPGHIKLIKEAADPDPTEFMLPSIKMERADLTKPYNTKKGVWIPNPNTRGYGEGILESRGLALHLCCGS